MSDIGQNSVENRHVTINSVENALKSDEVSGSVVAWYLNKINEMNLQYYEGKNKNIIVQYPPDCEQYICISNQVRNTNERDLLNDISCIFSSVECLNVLKRSDVQFTYGVRLVINPSSATKKQNRISSDKLLCCFEIKIVESDLLGCKDDIGIVSKLISKDGKHVQYLSKSFNKIIERSTKDLSYKYHIIDSYVVDDFSYLPKNVPLSFILFPKEEKTNSHQSNDISHINIEKTSQLLLNTIKKLNE